MVDSGHEERPDPHFFHHGGLGYEANGDSREPCGLDRIEERRCEDLESNEVAPFRTTAAMVICLNQIVILQLDRPKNGQLDERSSAQGLWSC